MTSDNLLNNIYCPEQIHIPITFPNILKLYSKAAIRTQPYDLLKWTAAYFRALANKEVPPVKERLEYPPLIHSSGMTLGYLKTLLNRFGKVNKVPLRAILEHWQGIDLTEYSLYQICLIGGFLEGDRNCDFYRFLAISCGFLSNIIQEEEEEEEKEKEKKEKEKKDEEEEEGEIVHEELDYVQVPDHLSYKEESVNLNLEEENIERRRRREEEEEEDVGEGEGMETWYQMESMEDYFGEFVDAFSDVCTCPKREVEHIPTPPAPPPPPPPYDPVEEFIKRMETEIEKGRLKRIFRIDGIGPVVSEKQVIAVGIWLGDCARRQEGLVGPRNIKHFLCPDLQDPNSDCQSR
ncbi:hypothetical protein M0802_004157 [Mischocyttarus mexicanus]|nr:hypothetical protein M0802_004157 [Mischocyttarus mexicanus]